MAKVEIPSYKIKKPVRFSRHPKPGYVIRCRLWLEKDGELYIGGGRVALLENIDKFGSIAAAARSMGLGYRNAWLWVEAMNRLAPVPLVQKSIGGADGGHTILTEEGRKVIAEYKRLNARFQRVLKEVT